LTAPPDGKHSANGDRHLRGVFYSIKEIHVISVPERRRLFPDRARLPLPFATFGILVALAALTAAAWLRRALRRLHAEGHIGLARRFMKDAQGRRSAVELAPHTLVGDFTMVVLFACIGGRSSTRSRRR
jgi:hypothetical protein